MKPFLRSVLLAAFITAPLAANTFSFQGVFASDDQLQLFDFSISATATVTIQSLAYGGGTASNAIVVNPGGFDTLFTLFQQDGTQMGLFDDDPGCAHSAFHNGACLDAYFSGSLSAGSYVLALTVSGNDPNGDLGQGFGQQGNGNFTCANGFCDVYGNQNNGTWAVDFLGVDSSAVVTPEPGMLPLVGTGMTFLALARCLRRPRNSELRSQK